LSSDLLGFDSVFLIARMHAALALACAAKLSVCSKVTKHRVRAPRRILRRLKNVL
jgi:hypothetical protein